MNLALIIIYRNLSLIVNLIATLYVLTEVYYLLTGYSSFNNSEDLSILLFIIIAIYFSVSFSLETTKHFRKKSRHFEVINAEEIKKGLRENIFSRFPLYGNLIIGIIIILFMLLILISEPIKELLNDIFRLIHN